MPKRGSASSGRSRRRRIDRKRARVPKVEEEGEDGIQRCLASRESTKRRRRRWRSSWACRRGEGEAVAAVVHVGGGGRVRVVRGREPEEGRSCGCETEVRGRVASSGAVRGVGRSSRWLGRVDARVEHATLVLLVRGGR